MTWFVRNTWYVAAFVEELEADFVNRTICGEPIVMFRKGNGDISAIQDRCPHRFVPLSMGKRVGDTLMCGYHGLRFAGDGSCVELPFEHGQARPDVCVKSYPAVARDTIVWLWMGEPEKADPALIPDFGCLTDLNYTTVRGHSYFKCNYQILSDNLLDLSHVHILHPGIHDGSDYASFRNEIEVDGSTIWSMLWRPKYAVNELRRQQWGMDIEEGEGQGHTRWNVPGVLLVESAVWPHGSTIEQGARFPSSHLLTPETEYSAHYFWTTSRNYMRDDEVHSHLSQMAIRQIFETQDGPMAEAQQRAMGTETDLHALRPSILKADKAGVIARRLIKRLIQQENKAGAAGGAVEAPELVSQPLG